MTGAGPIGLLARRGATEFAAARVSFCNVPQMSVPEAGIQVTRRLITDDGEVIEERTEQFLCDYMEAVRRLRHRFSPALPREP